MTISEIDIEVVRKVLSALSAVRRAETETPDGRRITGYYVTDKQIRIDIVEARSK